MDVLDTLDFIGIRWDSIEFLAFEQQTKPTEDKSNLGVAQKSNFTDMCGYVWMVGHGVACPALPLRCAWGRREKPMPAQAWALVPG